MSPLLERETTLKDALSMMLDADVQAGIVVDAQGRVQGLLTVDAIGEVLRPERPRHPRRQELFRRGVDAETDAPAATTRP